jgi:hypothetical protein
MPKLLTPNNGPALATAPGTQGWRLVGLEVAGTTTLGMTYRLVEFGGTGAEQATLAQVPSRLVLDRSYVHGSATLDLRRCVALNSASTAIVDSYLADCHSNNGDSQAIAGWNGPGPYKIQNNYLEGGHMGIMFGGADPSVPDLVPSDIEIRRNHVTRPLAWRGRWQVKNLFELKVGQRVLAEGNVFENNWADAQTGFAFVFWSINPSGACPWCVTQDVTVRYNRVVNTPMGFQLNDRGSYPSPAMQRVTIAHNTVTGVQQANGRLVQINGAVAGLTVVNNSAVGGSHDVYFITPDKPLPDFVFRNNVTGGWFTFQSPVAFGDATLRALQIPAGNVAGNVFANTDVAARVPAGNAFGGAVPNVGFVDFERGDLRLAAGSPYRASGTGGSTPGADFAALDARTQGVAR